MLHTDVAVLHLYRLKCCLYPAVPLPFGLLRNIIENGYAWLYLLYFMISVILNLR